MPVVPPNIISNGVDLSVHGDGATFKNAGKLFVVRYLSPNSTNNPQKRVLASEITDYAKHDLMQCFVWETTTARARLSGYSGGFLDASLSQQQIVALHLPVNIPVYFAIDEDTTGPLVEAYFRGCVDQIGLARVGAYGGIKPLSWLFDNHRITYGWQTFAWSNGKLDSRCQAYQHQNGVNVGGYDCDLDYQLAPDFGQMNPDGTLGDVGVDMTEVDLTPAAVEAVRKAIMTSKVGSANVSPPSDKTQVTLEQFARDSYYRVDGLANQMWPALLGSDLKSGLIGEILAQSQANGTGISDIKTLLAGITGGATAAGVTPAELAAAYRAAADSLPE